MHPFGFILPVVHFGSRKTEFSRTGFQKNFQPVKNVIGFLSSLCEQENLTEPLKICRCSFKVAVLLEI
jgi:hypothetical protein